MHSLRGKEQTITSSQLETRLLSVFGKLERVRFWNQKPFSASNVGRLDDNFISSHNSVVNISDYSTEYDLQQTPSEVVFTAWWDHEFQLNFNCFKNSGYWRELTGFTRVDLWSVSLCWELSSQRSCPSKVTGLDMVTMFTMLSDAINLHADIVL